MQGVFAALFLVRASCFSFAVWGVFSGEFIFELLSFIY